MTKYYLDTSNSRLVIRVPGNIADGLVVAVPHNLNLDLNLVNPLLRVAMAKARRAARRAGTRLHHPNRVAISRIGPR